MKLQLDRDLSEPLGWKLPQPEGKKLDKTGATVFGNRYIMSKIKSQLQNAWHMAKAYLCKVISVLVVI